MIQLYVAGDPLPQGSKTGFILRGKTRKQDRVVLKEVANNATKKRKAGALKRWRKAIAEEARKHAPAELIAGPVDLTIVFVLERPKSHWLKSGRIAKGKPRRPIGRPDKSKLTRAVEDALSGVIYRDDSQVVDGRVRKRYQTIPDEETGAHIIVTAIPDEETEAYVIVTAIPDEETEAYVTVGCDAE